MKNQYAKKVAAAGCALSFALYMTVSSLVPSAVLPLQAAEYSSLARQSEPKTDASANGNAGQTLENTEEITAEVDAGMGIDELYAQFLSASRQEEPFGPQPLQWQEYLVVLEGTAAVDRMLPGQDLSAYYDSAAGQIFQQLTRRRQQAAADLIEELVDMAEIECEYEVLLNGLAVKAPAGSDQALSAVEGVKDVVALPQYQLFDEEETALADGEGDANSQEGEAVSADLASVSPQSIEPTGQTVLGTAMSVPEASSLGYNGEHTVVAVIDTGVDISHEVFANAVSNPALSDSDVLRAVLKDEFHGGAPKNTTTKVPYYWNYAGNDESVTGKQAHGTHVAGSAVGKSNYLLGIAPEAQLVAMRIFDDQGMCSISWMMAALEDCALLSVDVVNLSVGDPGGYPSDSYQEAVFEKLEKAGVRVVASAGNNSASTKKLSDSQAAGLNLGLARADEPDNSITAAPGTFSQSLCVASAGQNGTTWRMSDFSSIGPGADLDLKPEVTGPGEYIYASILNNSYGKMSGTSMSCPQVAALSALVSQSLQQKYPDKAADKTWLSATMKALVMNTADPLHDSSGVPITCRKQGAGMANAAKAVSSPAVAVESQSQEAKIALGGSPSGTFEKTAQIVVTNLSDAALHFEPSVINTVPKIESVSDSEGNAYPCVSESSRILDSQEMSTVFSSSNLSGNVLTVPAGGSVTLSVSWKLSAQGADSLEDFENGIYLEGFVTLKSTDENGVDLSLPWLGFWKDWESGSVFDATVYEDRPASIYQGSLEIQTASLQTWTLGDNIFTEEMDACADAIAFNPSDLTNNGAATGLINGTIGQLRHLDVLTTKLGTASKPNKFVYTALKNPFKTIYDTNIQAFRTLGLLENWDACDDNKTVVSDGQYILELSASREGTSTTQTRRYVLKADSQAPRLSGSKITQSQTGTTLELTMKDSSCLMGWQLVSEDGNTTYTTVMTPDGDPATQVNAVIDVTSLTQSGVNTVRVIMYDYAHNRAQSAAITIGQTTLDDSLLRLVLSQQKESMSAYYGDEDGARWQEDASKASAILEKPSSQAQLDSEARALANLWMSLRLQSDARYLSWLTSE